MTGAYSLKAFKAQSKKTVFLLWFQNKQSIVSSNQSVVLLLNKIHHSKTVFKLSQKHLSVNNRLFRQNNRLFQLSLKKKNCFVKIEMLIALRFNLRVDYNIKLPQNKA